MKKFLLWLLPGGLALWLLFRLVFGKVSLGDNGKFSFSSLATRELRANNPLGVSLSKTYDWENVDTSKNVANQSNGNIILGVDDLKGDKLVIFKETQDGLNAAAWLLAEGYFGHGYNTVGAIGDRWAGKTPVPPNKFSDYAINLWAVFKGYRSSVKIDDEINLATDGIPLMKSLARMENGSIPVARIPDEMYRAAIAYALT